MNKMKRQPKNLSTHGWKQVLAQTKIALKNKDLSMFAAGVAYFSTLAFFPTLAAFISIYALFVSPASIIHLGESAKHFLPAAMADLVTRQLLPLAKTGKKSLIAAVIAILIALFSASSGMQNLIKALNHAYDVTERRKGIKLRLISLAYTIGLVALAFPLLGLIVMQPSFLRHLGVPGGVALGLAVGRWVVLAGLITLILAIIYRYAPDRREARWSIVSWGGGAATIIWLLGTVGFFLYVQYLSSFTKTYGIFAGIIILMSWLNLSAFIILLGAEVNHHLEEATEPVAKLKALSPRRLFELSK